MSPIRIPEGYVFVPKGENVAKQLLEAADAIKADRKNDVRTVSGGYHVTEAVAERYQADLPDEIVADSTEGEPIELTGEPVEPGAEVKGGGSITRPDGTQVQAAEDGIPVLGAEDEVKESELKPLPVTVENTVAEIDEYAEKAGVDISKAKNKAEKIELLEAARKPQNDAE